MAYITGDAVTLTATFKDSSGALADPTDVTLEVQDPNGTITTYTYSLSTITKSSTGIYTRNVSLTDNGTWEYEWQGTGAVAKVGNGRINVRAQII